MKAISEIGVRSNFVPRKTERISNLIHSVRAGHLKAKRWIFISSSKVSTCISPLLRVTRSVLTRLCSRLLRKVLAGSAGDGIPFVSSGFKHSDRKSHRASIYTARDLNSISLPCTTCNISSAVCTQEKAPFRSTGWWNRERRVETNEF